MAVIHINKDNFEQIKNGEQAVLIDFYADWCGPCRMVAPIVEELAKDNPDVVIGKVNVDNDPELAQAYGVMSIPTLIVLKGGQEVARSTGARPKAQLQAMLEK